MKDQSVRMDRVEEMRTRLALRPQSVDNPAALSVAANRAIADALIDSGAIGAALDAAASGTINPVADVIRLKGG